MAAGIVLCGGESQRMGQAKAWLPFGVELMLPRAVRLLGEAVQPIIVVAAPEQDLPPLPTDVSIVRDEERGRGPLAGIAAGLAALSGAAEVGFVSSCDAPFLRPAFVRRMLELRGDHLICVPRVGAHTYPLTAVYRIDVLDAVKGMLGANRLKTQELFEVVPTRVVSADELLDVDPQLESLRNINTPAEYEQALRDRS